MTTYAQWGGAQITSTGVGTGPGIRASIGGFVAVANPNSAPSAQTAILSYARASSPCVFELIVGSGGIDAFQFGFIMGEPSATTGTGTVNSLQINQNGVVLFNGGDLFTLTYSQSVMFYVIPGGKCWFTPDDTGVWYDGTSTYTLTQVEAGTGGLSLSGFSAAVSPVANFYGPPWQGIVHLVSGQRAFIATPPAGVGYLPASLWGAVQPASPSGTITMPWTNPQSLTGTLEYSADGTTWLSCGGSNSGTGGLATAGVAPSTEGLTRYYYFRDSGNHTSQTPPQTLFVIAPPSGSGSLVAWGAGSVEGAPVPSWSIDLPGGPFTKLYTATALAGGNYSNATQLLIYDAATNPTFGWEFDNTFSSRNNLTPQYGPSGTTGDSGAYAAYGTTALAYDVLDASTITAGAAYGTAVLTDIVQSGTGTLGPSAWPPGTLATPRFVSAAFLDSNSFGQTTYGQDLAFAIWAPPVVETLTLSTVSNASGSLLATGSVANGSLTTSIDLDIGAGYVPSTSFTLSGGAWSAMGQALTPGTLTVTAKDPVTGVESNSLPLVVSTEFITIVTSVGTFGVPLALQGTDINGPASAMDVAYDGSWLGTLSAFTTSGGTASVWSGTGPSLPFGTQTVQVRNHSATSITSNIITLTATVPINVWPTISVPPVTLQNTIPSYLYQQYIDDENLQGFVAAYNTLAQQEVDWFNQLSFPVYAGNPQVVGNVLDWVGAALYGYPRPVLASPNTQYIGAIATAWIMQLSIMGEKQVGSGGVFVTSDDIYKRVLTWYLYRGDGMQFNIKWLKRRIMRFIYGVDGTDFIIDQTYPVSITVSGSAVTISLIGTPGFISSVFASAIASGILALPPFYTYSVST